VIVLATSAQLLDGLNVPVEFVAKLTLPDGVVGPDVAVDVTVAVHLEAWFTTTGVEQVRVVEVGCILVGLVTSTFTVTERNREPTVPFTTTW
jgi:hypothetical protein